MGKQTAGLQSIQIETRNWRYSRRYRSIFESLAHPCNQALKVAVKERLQRWHTGEEAVLWAEEARAPNPRARRGRKRVNPTEETEEQERVRRNAERARIKAGEGQMTGTYQLRLGRPLGSHPHTGGGGAGER